MYVTKRNVPTLVQSEVTCFHCSKSIPNGDSRVWWHGPNESGEVIQIALHRDCTAVLSAKLLNDFLVPSMQYAVR